MKKKILITTITILLVASITIIYFFFANQNQLPISKNVSRNVLEICKEKSKIECHGNCMDGFAEIGYFDSRKYSKQDFLDTPEELYKTYGEKREMILASHYQSSCDPCGNKFELNKNGVFQEVSCEEFFETIENINKSCNGCVNTIYLQISG
ncbi:MAG: hypothetical protein U5L76_01200 [Patescibacteria group bacterium]|nr:hypothetical protein [Patescibacteria group bacterium]